MSTSIQKLKATTVKGSVDLVKTCFSRGDRFTRFNEGFVRVYPKRPEITPATLGDVLSDFFREGGPDYGSPFLVNVEFYEQAMRDLGHSPSAILELNKAA